jgi:alpha-1,6-mannosyltransferase
MLLLDCFEHLMKRSKDNYQMLIIGNGPLRNSIEQRAEENLKGKVHFLDHLACREELAELLANCDAYIHPNPREPFGIGPLEAMASQLPVILPNRGGVMTYADRSNSWPSPPDAENFSQAVLDVFNFPEERHKRILAARKRAEEFSWEKVFSNLLEMFERFHARRLGVIRNTGAA